jgi:hypothetical protein
MLPGIFVVQKSKSNISDRPFANERIAANSLFPRASREFLGLSRNGNVHCDHALTDCITCAGLHAAR